ncbi:MAG: hypothetical protein IJW55_07405 [Clostridia bacterium]|nr:hypothetical protein [Clostridia bacterium]
MNPLIWKTHKHKDDFTECPHCQAPLNWIYVRDAWIPCDKEPTLFILHPYGKQKIVYKKELYENCLIYRKGDKRFDREVLQGQTPHYYTCPVLKERRKLYAARIGEKWNHVKSES